MSLRQLNSTCKDSNIFCKALMFQEVWHLQYQSKVKSLSFIVSLVAQLHLPCHHTGKGDMN